MMMKRFHTIEKNEIDKIMKSSHTIDKNEIKKSVIFFLTSDDLERFHNAIVE